jgi:hypothetical protein
MSTKVTKTLALSTLMYARVMYSDQTFISSEYGFK